MSWLPGDEEVEIVSAAAHVGKDLDTRGRDAFAVGADGAFRLVVFVQDTLQDGRVALGHFPVAAHLAQRVDEEVNVRADVVLNGGAMHEKEPCGNPEGEGERGPEFVEHAVADNVLAQGGDVPDCLLAALGRAERRSEDG